MRGAGRYPSCPVVKKPKNQSLSSRALAPSGARPLVVPVERDATAGTITLRIDQGGVTGAENTFGADCALARLRHGLCELVFVQLDPFDDAKAVRVVAARYSPERFLERREQNETFRTQLEESLRSRRGVVGALEMLANSARAPANQSGWSVIVEAEHEIIARVGDRAAMLFLSGSAIEMHAAASGLATHVTLSPRLEVTIPVLALADLLVSWKNMDL